MLMLGAIRDGLFKVPARSMVTPVMARGREKTVEPHLGQKVRSVGCPLPPSFVNVLVAPLTLTEASGTAAIVKCPPPVSFWQSVQ